MELLTLTEAERRYGVPRWCLRGWIEEERLSIAPDLLGEEILELRRSGLSMQAIADHLGVSKRLVQLRLEGARPVDRVRAQDVERLVAEPHVCKGCGRPVEPGRNWHPSCAGHQEKAREKARATCRAPGFREAARERMSEWWADESRRAEQARQKRELAEVQAQEFAAFKAANDLLDADEMVLAIGAIRWRDTVSRGRVVDLARERGIGLLVEGFGGHANKRRVFAREDIPLLRACFKTETRDGHCVDCGRPTYASVRCERCGNAERSRRVSQLHASYNAELEAFKQENGLRTADEAALVLDRAKTKVIAWAIKLEEVGTRVPSILGLPERWLFSDQDIDCIRERIDALTAASEAGGMLAIRSDLADGYPRWYERRFKTTRMWGKLAPVRARQRGQKPGPKFQLSEEERREILRLRQDGLSIREIAGRVGLSKGQVERQIRVARAGCPVTPPAVP